MTVTWFPSVSADVRAIFEPEINKLLWLCPTWVQGFYVEFDGDGADDHYATIRADLGGRFATLTIKGSLLCGHAAPDICRVMCHEIAHLYTSPATSSAENYIDMFFPDGPTPGTKIAKAAINEVMEGSTEDLARLFYKITYEGARG